MPATRLFATIVLATATLLVLSSCSSSAPTATSTPPATSAPAATASSVRATPTTAAAAPTATAQGTVTTPAGLVSPTPEGSSSGVARFTGIPWAVGQSASYTMTSGSTTTSFTYALVGKEGSNWWMETKVQPTGESFAIAKMLMVDPATGMTQVKRMIIQQQGQAAYELPFQFMQQGQQPITPTEAKINQSIVGTETKMVKGGKFTNATHAKYAEGSITTDGYFHSTVPITGMVYITVTDSSQPPVTLELLSFKMSGATTEITGLVGSGPGS